MNGMKYKYKYLTECQDVDDDPFVFESNWRHDIGLTPGEFWPYIAEDAGRDFVASHDGCEIIHDAWPLVFTLYTMDGKEIRKFDVNRELVDRFDAVEH